jgi:hypothetical protein
MKTTSELQIGDIVYSNVYKCNCVITLIGAYSGFLTFYGKDIEMPYHINDLEHIGVTDNFLEKNFEKTELPKDGIHSALVHYRYVKDKTVVTISGSEVRTLKIQQPFNTYIDNSLNKKIENINDIQHLLREFGVEKELVI